MSRRQTTDKIIPTYISSISVTIPKASTVFTCKRRYTKVIFQKLALEGSLSSVGGRKKSFHLCISRSLNKQYGVEIQDLVAGDDGSKNSREEWRITETTLQSLHKFLPQTMSSGSSVLLPFVDILEERHGRVILWLSPNTCGTTQYSLFK